MDGLAEKMEDLKNTENLSNTDLQISRLQAKMDKVDSEQLIVLTYLGIYFLYLIIEALHLMIRRSLSCSAFKKNLSPKKELMDGSKDMPAENCRELALNWPEKKSGELSIVVQSLLSFLNYDMILSIIQDDDIL